MEVPTSRTSEKKSQLSNAMSGSLVAEGVVGGVVGVEVDGRDHRLALGHLAGGHRKLVAGGGVALAGVVERLAADDLAAADQVDQQRPVVVVAFGWPADADHLRLGDAAL